MCTYLYLCDRYAMSGFAFFFLILVFIVGCILVSCIALYYEAKTKMPPVSSDDIQRIIDDARRRAREYDDH